MALIPFDETGRLSSNLKTESHTLQNVNGTNYYYFIPKWAPFYKAGFSVIKQGESNYLEEGTDFIFVYELTSADDALVGKIYGGIALLDNTATGTYIMQMQSLGGDFVTATTQAIADGFSTLETLQTTKWSDIATPATFPSTYHTHPVTDVDGVTEVVDSMNQISQTLEGQPKNIQMSDIGDLDTAYITPLLNALAEIKSALSLTGNPVAPLQYENSLAGSTVDLGAVAADTWVDLPLTITATQPGTYLFYYDLHPLVDDMASDIVFQWLADDATMVRGGLNGFRHAVTAGSVLKLQMKIVGGSTTHCYLSDDNRSAHITLTYVGV